MSSVHWSHLLEDLIAEKSPLELVQYYSINPRHRQLFEQPLVLDMLTDKINNKITVTSFNDFYEFVMQG